MQASEADKSNHLVSDELVFSSSHQRQTAGHVQLDLRSTCRDCQGIDSSPFLTPQREKGQGRLWAGHWECSLPCLFCQRLLCADGLMREAHYMYCRTAALQASIRSAPQIVSPLQQYLPALRLCSQHHCMRKQEHALSSGTHMAIMQLCAKQSTLACRCLSRQFVLMESDRMTHRCRCLFLDSTSTEMQEHCQGRALLIHNDVDAAKALYCLPDDPLHLSVTARKIGHNRQRIFHLYCLQGGTWLMPPKVVTVQVQLSLQGQSASRHCLASRGTCFHADHMRRRAAYDCV